MRGDIDPGRALFCIYHGIDKLPTGVWLLPCSHRLCINPLHREMKSTKSHRWEVYAQLPHIRNKFLAQAPIQVDESNEDFQQLLSYFENYGKAWAETQTPEMLEVSEEQFAAAFQKMEWT